MMRRGHLSLLLLSFALLLVVMLGGSPRALAQGGGWSPPFEVADTVRFSWFPDLTVVPGGQVAVIWGGSDRNPRAPNDQNQNIDVLRYRELRDGAWSPVNEIVMTGFGAYTVRNSIVYGRDGLLHAIVRYHTELYAISAPAAEAWSARAWSEPVQVSDSSGYYCALAVDSHNRLHAVYSQAVIDPPGQPREECPQCSDLYYRYSDNGGKLWSNPQNLSKSDDGENRPQIVVDAQDHLHVVWDQGVDWYAGAGVAKYGVYVRSDDRGLTWSEPLRFGSPEDPIQQTAIAVTSVGNPMIAYRSVKTRDIFFQSSADGGSTWTLPGPIPGVLARNLNDNNLDRYAMAADSADRVHLLVSGFVDPGQENPWLVHLTWDGNTWSSPRPVMQGPLFPEWPRLIVSGGNQLHATWFTRHSYDLFSSVESPDYEVWYSTLALDTPAIAPLPTFTPVPTVQLPTPTPLPTSTLPPTPLPASLGRIAPNSGPPAWEQPGLVTIAIALVPTVGLLALLLSVRSRWRR